MDKWVSLRWFLCSFVLPISGLRQLWGVKKSSLCSCLFCQQCAGTFTVCWAVSFAFSSVVNPLYKELILPTTKHVWCWWWSYIKKNKIVTGSQEACQVEQLNQEQNLSQRSCGNIQEPVLKTSCSKFRSEDCPFT